MTAKTVSPSDFSALAERVAALEERFPARKPFKILVSKEWCMKMAAAEEGYSVEAGIMHPEAPQPSSPSLDALKAEATDEDGPLWCALDKWRRAADGTPKRFAAEEIDETVRALLGRAHALGHSHTPPRISLEDTGEMRERALSLPPKHARLAAAALRQWVTITDDTWREGPPGDWDWNDIGVIGGTISVLDALGRGDQAAATGDTRQRAAEVILPMRSELEVSTMDIVEALDAAGPLASTPQPAVVKWNDALDLLYKTMRAPLGTASDGLLAVLRSIPGIKIEEA